MIRAASPHEPITYQHSGRPREAAGVTVMGSVRWRSRDVNSVLEIGVDEFVELDAEAHASRWARRWANRCSISPQVSVRASPVMSVTARRCVSADHRSSISVSSAVLATSAR